MTRQRWLVRDTPDALGETWCFRASLLAYGAGCVACVVGLVVWLVG